MEYSARLSKLDNLKGEVTFYQEPNKERLRTMYNGDISNISMEINFPDPRRFTPKQRGLMFALFNNIYEWSNQELGSVEQDIPVEVIGDAKTIKDWFYSQYILKYQKDISVKNISNTTVSEMNNLLELIIDFMFEWDVPFAEGYELLPKNEQWYLYRCCKHRKCAECGKRAEIHHAINLVGMGNNRNSMNHLNSYFIALCRTHHNEIHNLGLTEFSKKYHGIKPIKLDDETLIRLNLMSVKQVREIKENE